MENVGIFFCRNVMILKKYIGIFVSSYFTCYVNFLEGVESVMEEL